MFDPHDISLVHNWKERLTLLTSATSWNITTLPTCAFFFLNFAIANDFELLYSEIVFNFLNTVRPRSLLLSPSVCHTCGHGNNLCLSVIPADSGARRGNGKKQFRSHVLARPVLLQCRLLPHFKRVNNSHWRGRIKRRTECFFKLLQ